MVNLEFSSILKNTKACIVAIMFQQNRIPPQIFFSLIFIKQLGLLNQYDTSYALFYVGLLFFIITNYNHFFLYSHVLISNIGVLGPYNILIGIININQKWRLYLFCFSTGYYSMQYTGPLLQVFVIFTSFFICIQIYKTLMFSTVHDNLVYFSGFFTLFCIHIIKKCISMDSNYTVKNPQLLYILPIIFAIGFVIIKKKVVDVQSSQPCLIKNPLILTQYLNLLNSLIQQDENILGYILGHKKLCNKIECFCHIFNYAKMESENKKKLQQQIVSNVFQQIFYTRNWQQQDHLIIVHKYISFLIKSNKLHIAIQILSEYNENSMSYFNKCLNFRVKTQLKKAMNNQQYFNLNLKKLKYICEYDLQVSFVLKQIRQIMYKKILLWRQLCKQNPQVKILQKMGYQLVDKIEKLHKYFMLKVRIRQDILSVFKCTIIYSLYLALTTNYLQLANSLLKKAKKMAQQAKVDIQVNNQFGIFLRVSQNYHKRVQTIFQSTIINITSGLCDNLHRTKQSLLFKNLIQIIPSQFQQPHMIKFDEFFKKANFNKEKSQFIGIERQLPFKINHEQVVFLNIITTLDYDILYGSPILKCIAKKQNNQTLNFIIDFNSEIRMREESQMCIQYATTPIVLNALSTIKKEWESTGQIKAKQDSLLSNDHALTITLQPFFQQFFSKQEKNPLVKVVVKGDIRKNQRMKTDNFNFINNITNVQGILQSKETDSQSSNTSRKDSVQNVLAMLMQSSSLKTQMFLVVTLFLLSVSVIVCFVVCLNFFTLWDTSQKQFNPTFTIYNIVNMKSLFNNALSWNYDILSYNKISYTTNDLFKVLLNYTSIDYIKQTAQGQLLQIFEWQQNILNNYLFGFNSQITELLADQLMQPLQIPNKVPDQKSINMTVQSLIGNYLVDIYIMQQGQNFYSTVMSFTYLSQFYAVFEKVTEIINNSLLTTIVQVRRNNVIVLSFVVVLIVLFIIPIWRFNIKNKKRHQKIYSLLASLQPKLILDQIKKLEKMQTDIFINFPQAPNLSKTNVNEQYFYNQQKQRQRQRQKQNNKKNQQKTGQSNFAIGLHMIYQGVKKLTAEQIAANTINKNKIKIRKRAGQIIIDGSNCDVKKIRVKDWIILVFLVVFLGLMNALIWHKISIIDHVNNHFLDTSSQINYIQNNILGLLNSKILNDYYDNNNKIQFEGTDLNIWMRDWIINFNYTSGFSIEDQVKLQICLQDNLACKNKYSQKIYQALIKKVISDSYKLNLEYLNNPSINTTTNMRQKSRFMLFFAQQISDIMSQTKRQWIVDSFTQLEKYTKQSIRTQNMIFAFFAIAVIVFNIFAVFYIVWVKMSYVKQVTLLAILNKEMLYNNKRVQSFVHKLSKNQ